MKVQHVFYTGGIQAASVIELSLTYYYVISTGRVQLTNNYYQTTMATATKVGKYKAYCMGTYTFIRF